MTCTLKVKVLNFETTFRTLLSLKLTSYNSFGCKSLSGLNSMVRSSVQYAFPATAGEKSNSSSFSVSLTVWVVVTSEESCMRMVFFLEITPEV